MAECEPLSVEGDWDPAPQDPGARDRTLRNKLQLYFQSRKKSSGGDCRVELEEGAAAAAVFFRSPEVRERVLARKDHQIVLDKRTVSLRLSSTPKPPSRDADSADPKPPEPEEDVGAAAPEPGNSERAQTAAVVLENVPVDMTRDLLMMLVENVSGVEEDRYSLEVLRESGRAVVVFLGPQDAEKFVALSQTNSKMQKQGLRARVLEAAKSVRVESLPPTVVKDMLEMWFEKNWVLPDDVVMIPEEQAAIVTFSDPQVVQRISLKEDHAMRSIPVKLFPYYESLGTRLYGPERPDWRMPEPFTERVEPVVWKFLLQKNLLQSISEQMHQHFCSVDLDAPAARLCPLPGLLRQKGLTAEVLEGWRPATQKAFCQLLSQYSAFECVASAEAWDAAEKEVQLVVKEEGLFVFDASRGVLTVAGRADSVREIRAPVETIVLKAMTTIERRTKSVTEGMALSPAEVLMLQQEGDPGDSERAQTAAVVLDNVPGDMTRDLLMMLVENVSGVEEDRYSLEVLRESGRAVVVFLGPQDAEKFVALSQTNSKMQKQGLRARVLEAAKSVRVESLPPTVIKDMLEMWFEKNWVLPDDVVMIPEEQAAIVTFSDPQVVQRISLKEDHAMRSIPVKLFPYYESLGTRLYGPERPDWRMPEPFTEHVEPVVWKFLLQKNLLQSISEQMHQHFCSVDLDAPAARLCPLPGLLRQKGLTAEVLEGWRPATQKAFCQLLSQYSAFECVASAEGWDAAEKWVRLVMKDEAVLVFDASRGVLTVAGRADSVREVRAPVETIVLKAMTTIKWRTKSVTEGMALSPAEVLMLQQVGLDGAARDISPELKLCYDQSSQVLSITGLPAEVYQTKLWVVEKNMSMERKELRLPPGLQGYLQTVDPTDMSKQLFTSQGISAMYFLEKELIFLLGSSSQALADAERKMRADLSVEDLDMEDQEVTRLQTWAALNQQLLDAYNMSSRKTVAIVVRPERRLTVTVAGFLNPVKEVSRSLKDFIWKNSRVQETIRVKSGAFILFLQKKKLQMCSSIEKDNNVSVYLDQERPRITVGGARVQVQSAKSSLQQLLEGLSADTLTVDKPGAKKYFQSQGIMLLLSVMTDFSVTVVLQPEEDEEEEEEDDACYCRVETSRGVLVSVSRADICRFRADGVVNAANEDLQHIGGVANALLRAAGPQLQKASDDYIATHGKLSTGNAVVTGAYQLPCSHVVHAVGPRFSDQHRDACVRQLRATVNASLRQAEAVGCRSIALPAISSDVFGFPVQLCAETIARAVREFCDGVDGPGPLTQIHLVDNRDDTVRVMAAAVNGEFRDLGPTLTIPTETGGRSTRASGSQRGRGKGRGKNFPRRGRGGGRGGGERGGGGRGGGERGGGGRGGRVWGGPSSYAGNSRHGEYGGPRRTEQSTVNGLKIGLCQGNIQDQTTDVIINTIAENLNLNQGAISKAILGAAGPGLQNAVYTTAGVASLPPGNIVITDALNLRCRKVFHAVCPFWDNGGGQAEKELTSIITSCLEEAENLQMASLSFPALGTGNLGFPIDLVVRVLLREIHSFSRWKSPQHLRRVEVVVHPSDTSIVNCFTREFSGQTSPNAQQEVLDVNRSATGQPPGRVQQSSASFSQVSSPTLGVYRMQMGQLTLEVSSGDITKEACDVIINSSNHTFNHQSGVSQAILGGAGAGVQAECSQIVSAPRFVPCPMIITTGGQLPCKNIIHIVGQKDPGKIKEVVYAVLKLCEDNRFTSVALPALGTGQGGVAPAAVADAMLDAVVDFVRKKSPRFVGSVKILVFQTVMMTEFHNSMKKKQGQGVEEKGLLGKFMDSVNSFFGPRPDQSSTRDLVLEREEFEPAVFQLCGDNPKAVSLAKERIRNLIVSEQDSKSISDQYLHQLSQEDLDELHALQRKLTVSIHLDRGRDDQEPRIHLEGLTRDVMTAESTVRDIIRKVERKESLYQIARRVSSQVEWKFQDPSGTMVTFDPLTNLKLEEALERKTSVRIQILNQEFRADPEFRKAVSANGQKKMELLRKDLRGGEVDLLPPTCRPVDG